MERSVCPAGCGTADKEVLKGDDRLHGLPGVFRVVECQGCGLMRTDPRPTVSTIGYFYPEGYGPHKPSDRSPCGLRKAIGKSLAGRVVSRLAGRQERTVPPLREGANVLEVGFGNADFLMSLGKNRWNLYGVESSREMVSSAKRAGIKASCGELKDARYHSGYFDAVFAWHVMEHLHDPAKAAEEVYRVLRPGGYFIIGAPNAASWEFKVFRSNWYALQLPTHLFHFTPATIKGLLERAGFKDVAILYPESITNVVMSIIYSVESVFTDKRPLGARGPLKRSFLLKLLLRPLALIMKITGQSGRMIVEARK